MSLLSQATHVIMYFIAELAAIDCAYRLGGIVSTLCAVLHGCLLKRRVHLHGHLNIAAVKHGSCHMLDFCLTSDFGWADLAISIFCKEDVVNFFFFC